MGNGWCCGFEWFNWFDQWHHRPSGTLNVKLNSRKFRAPQSERDVNRGIEVMTNLIKSRKVEVVKFTLNIEPTPPGLVNVSKKQELGTSGLQLLTCVRGVQVELLENSHILPKFMIGLLKFVKDEKKGTSLTHISLPMFGVGQGDKDILVAIIEALQGTNVESLRLENISHEGVLLVLLKHITRLLEGQKGITTNLKELLIIYEMEHLSDKLAQSVHSLLLTDKLHSFQLSRNKIWCSSVGTADVETGIDDRFTKYVARALLKVTNLKRLDLSNNHITDLGAKYLHTAFYKNKNLRLNVLFLAKNLIDDSAIGVFKELTKQSRDNSLRYLDFSMNRIKERTFIELMRMTEKTLRLEKINLTSHDLNLDMYRLKHGTMLRTNENRRYAPRPHNNRRPYPELQIQLASNNIDALPYPAALPSWLFCGVCCLLKGPGHGDHLSLDNLIQGNLLKKGRSGYAGSLFAICLGMFLFFFSFAFPYVIMSTQDGMGLNVKAGLSLAIFLTPLFGWMALIIFAAWRDPAGQWKRVSNPSFGLRCAPKNMINNFMVLFAIGLDFLQLISFQFQSSETSNPNQQLAGGQVNQYMDYIKLSFGRSTYEIVLYVVASIVAIWWLVAVFVISSLAVKKPENALKFPAAPITIPLLSNALFLVIVTNLLKALNCVYLSDPLTGIPTSYLFDTCDIGGGGLFNCGPYVMVCWEGRHRLLALLALVCLVLYLISAPTVGTFFSEDYSGEVDIKFIPVFSLLERFLKLLLSVIVIFMSDQHLAEQIISLLIIVCFFTAVIVMQPSQHVRWVNFLRAGLYGIVFWAGLCNLVAAAINDPKSFTPVIILLIGWAVIVLVAVPSMFYGCTIASDLKDRAQAGPRISRANLQQEDPPVEEPLQGEASLAEIEGRPSQSQAPGGPGPVPSLQLQGPSPVIKEESEAPVELRPSNPSLGGRLWNQIRKPVAVHLPSRPSGPAPINLSIRPSERQQPQPYGENKENNGGERSVTQQPGEQQHPPLELVGDNKSSPIELGAGASGPGSGSSLISPEIVEPGKDIEVGSHFVVRKTIAASPESGRGITLHRDTSRSRKPSTPLGEHPLGGGGGFGGGVDGSLIPRTLERGGSAGSLLHRGSLLVGVELDRGGGSLGGGGGVSYKPVLDPSRDRDGKLPVSSSILPVSSSMFETRSLEPPTRASVVTVTGGGGLSSGLGAGSGGESLPTSPKMTLPSKKMRTSGQFPIGVPSSPTDGQGIGSLAVGQESVSYAVKDVSRTTLEEKKNIRMTTPMHDPSIYTSARSEEEFNLNAPRKQHQEHRTPEGDGIGMDLKLSGSDADVPIGAKDDPNRWFEDVLKPGQDYVVQQIELDDLAVEFGDDDSEEAESDRKQAPKGKDEGEGEEEPQYEALVWSRY